MAEEASPRRLSRRAIIAGAGVVAAGAATAFALRPGGSDSPPPSSPSATPQATSSPSTSATNAPAPSATVEPPARIPQGEARLVSPRLLNFDTFDAVRTGEVSVLEVLNRTHSRLLRWDGEAGPGLAGDLAIEWETPDDLTWLFRLDPAAQWQSGEGLPARPLSAGDVVLHFERVLSLARDGALQGVQRPWDWLAIESVDSPGEGLIRVRTAAPEALLPHTLAGSFALIQRPEAVELLEEAGNELVPGHVSGTGPFIFEGFDDRRRLTFRAVPGDPRAGVERLLLAGPSTNVEAFAAHEVDEFIARDRRDAAEARDAVPAAVEQAMWEDTPVISTLAVGAEPWSDPRLRIALSSALSRRELVERLFGGRAQTSGPVPPAHVGFALDQQSLTDFPGFRDFETDAREARAAWLAAGGESLGEVSIDFPAPFDPRYSASSVVIGMLSEALGSTFTPQVDSYVNISRKAVEGQYGNGRAAFWFGWGPALVSPDPSRHLHETYHSGSATARGHGYGDPEVDAALEEIRTTLDIEERAALGIALQRTLLSGAAGGVLPWALQQSEHFVHGYLSGRRPSPFPAQTGFGRVLVDTPHVDYPERG